MKNTMEKIIRNTILSLALSLAVFIGFGIGAHAFTTTTGTVTSDNVKVRESASTSSDQVSSVKKGATVDILGEEKDESGTIWYKIKVKGDETGYIRNDLVSKSGGSSGDSSGGSGTTAVDQRSVEVLAENGTVRQGAGTDKDAVGKVKKGDIVTIVGETKASDGKKWYEITFGENGSQGYVRSDLVSETPVVASKSVKSEQTDAPSNDDGSPDVIAELGAVDDVMGGAELGDENGEESLEEPDVTSDGEPTAPTETGDGQYSISYEEDTWYLTDNSGTDSDKPQKMQIPQIVKLAKQAKEFHDKLALVTKVMIALGAVAVVLLVLVIILGIRLRDAAYYDDEEDEDDDDEGEEDEYDRYSTPSKKRSRGSARDDHDEDVRPKGRRRAREEDEEDEPRESRRGALRRGAADDAGERPSRRGAADDAAERPSRRGAAADVEERPSRRPAPADDDERVVRPSRGERPFRRRADDQVEERPSRGAEERTVRPSRRDDDSMYSDSRYEERQPSERRMREEIEPEEPSTRRAKNFLGDDDDFEFEFLDLDDDDR